jgi:hypothetical protein
VSRWVPGRPASAGRHAALPRPILDHLLASEDLRAIQINKNMGGPSVEEMLSDLVLEA